jgi:hypothetical protein
VPLLASMFEEDGEPVPSLKRPQGGMSPGKIVSGFRLLGSSQELKEFVVCKAL